MLKGQDLQLSASVVTTGFVNKAVTWSIDSTAEGKGAKIDPVTGLLSIPSTATFTNNNTITVTATSVYDSTATGTATITVSVPA